MVEELDGFSVQREVILVLNDKRKSTAVQRTVNNHWKANNIILRLVKGVVSWEISGFLAKIH